MEKGWRITTNKIKKESIMEQVLRSLTLDFFGKGKHKISPEVFFEKDNAIFLDVRSKEEAETLEFKLKHHSDIKSINIPVDKIPDEIDKLSKDKFIGIFCPGSVRSTVVYAYLLSKGFSDVRIIMGGYSALTEALKPGKVLQAIAVAKE